MSAPAKGPSATEQVQKILTDNAALFSAIGVLSKRNGAMRRNESGKFADADILAFHEWYTKASAQGVSAKPPCHPGILRILKLWRARMAASVESATVSNATRGNATTTKDILDAWIRAGETAPREACDAGDTAPASPVQAPVFNAAAIVNPILAKLEEVQRAASVAGSVPPAVESMAKSAISAGSAEELESVLKGVQEALKKQEAPALKQEVAAALQTLKDPIDEKLEALKAQLDVVKQELLAAVRDIPALQTTVQSQFEAVRAAATKEEIQAIVDALKRDIGQEHSDIFEKIQGLLTTGDLAKKANVTETREALQAELKDIREDLLDIKDALSTDVLRDRFQSQLVQLQALQAASAPLPAEGGADGGALAEPIAALKSILETLRNKVELEKANANANAGAETAEALQEAFHEITELTTALETKERELAQLHAAKTQSNATHAVHEETIANLTAQIAEKTAELERARGTEAADPARIGQLEAAVAVLQEELERAKAAVQTAAELKTRLEEEKAALATRIAALEQQLAAEREKSQTDSKRIAELTRDLRDCTEAKAQIAQDLETLRRTEAAAPAPAPSVEENRSARNAVYTKQIDELTKELSKLQVDYASAQQTAMQQQFASKEACEQQLAAAQKQHASDLAAAQKKHDTELAIEEQIKNACTNELESVKQQLAAAQQQSAAHEAAAAAAQAELRTLRAELDALKQRAEEAEHKVDSDKPEMPRLQAELTQTQTKLTDTQTKLETAEKDVKNRDAYYTKIHPKLLQHKIETFSPDTDYMLQKPSLAAAAGAGAASGRHMLTGNPGTVRGKPMLPKIAEGRGRKSRRAAFAEKSHRRTRRRS